MSFKHQFSPLPLLLALIFSSIAGRAQYVGFGESSPNSKIDVTHTGSTGSGLEITHSNASNTSPTVEVKNIASGDGISILMGINTSTKSGIDISHTGKGSAIRATSSTNNYASAISFGYFQLTGVQSLDHIALHGVNTATTNKGIGVKGEGGYAGLYGYSANTGLYAQGGFYGVRAVGDAYGLYASSYNSTGLYSTGPSYGLYGQSAQYGVYGSGSVYGVYSGGDLGASGTKTFLIDHPLDPENQYLRHFSIESDEVLNLYRGIAQLDANGQARITLPEYFDAINSDFSYQLTSIGSPQQPWVVEEITDNEFVVAGAPGARVSWTVMAKRNDRYMQANPRTAESMKEPENRGKYVSPELYQQAPEKGIMYQQQPADTRVPEASNPH